MSRDSELWLPEATTQSLTELAEPEETINTLDLLSNGSDNVYFFKSEANKFYMFIFKAEVEAKLESPHPTGKLCISLMNISEFDKSAKNLSIRSVFSIGVKQMKSWQLQVCCNNR